MGERQPHRWLIEWSEQSLRALRKLSSKDRMTVFHSVEHLAKAENPYRGKGSEAVVKCSFVKRLTSMLDKCLSEPVIGALKLPKGDSLLDLMPNFDHL